MRILSYLIGFFVLFLVGAFSSDESPHGKDFTVSCSTCHSAKGWALDKEIYAYDHSKTKMPLEGQHNEINCRLCHPTLVFSEAKAKTECINCHTDRHSQTVGNYCDRCHTPASWIVNNITEIHQQSRFPLIGVHTMTECQQCHKSESLQRYDVLGVECLDCHRANYMATTKPNHASVGFSTECSQCHNIFSYEWGGTGFGHNFFPLVLGHANVDCAKCHTNNVYTGLSADCYSCHRSDYEAATNPVHLGGCYPTQCTNCHTTNPGWSPVSFEHDNYFPIKSGKHSGINCNQCHTNPANCSFSCTDCHEHTQSKMDSKHGDVGGYSWVSSACYNCHPRGKAD